MSRQGIASHEIKSEKIKLEKEIINSFYKARSNHGKRYIKQILERQAKYVSLPTIAKVLKKNNLCAKSGRRKHWSKTKSKPEYLAEYIAKNKKDLPHFLQIVCADITEIKCFGGKFFVSGIIDVATKMLVGLRIDKMAKQEIVQEAIQDMFNRYGVPQMYHCDRGCQYTAIKTKEQLDRAGVIVSMSRPGTPHDNQPIESFWNTLKRELNQVTEQKYEQAKLTVFEYVSYYNSERLHSSNNYLTPQEKRLKTL